MTIERILLSYWEKMSMNERLFYILKYDEIEIAVQVGENEWDFISPQEVLMNVSVLF